MVEGKGTTKGAGGMTVDIAARLGGFDVELRGRTTVQSLQLPPEPPTVTNEHIDDGDSSRVLTRRQKVVLLLGVVVMAASARFAPLPTALAGNIAIVLFFSAANVFKLWLVRR